MKSNKYNARATVIDGIRFASKKEGNRYVQLSEMQKKGEIKDLILQPDFYFYINGKPVCAVGKKGRKTHYKYVADFQYTDCKTNKTVVEDVKGYDTPLSKLKRSLVKPMHNVDVRLI